ncbi:pilus assembly protein TadG-related protein [Streptomyces sp. NPDC101181]|uniref:pilus assembly protein TadG-related protein n=1 Tax=Streptomyces sp. NPDC101181 TaxID=3366125 RepID=UPI00380FD8D2
MRPLRHDRGQAFPIYVVMVAGLLFLAFAFFAVGKAAALRNSSQGAADAAALAAAQAAREDIETGFIAALPLETLDLLLEKPFNTARPCAEARRLASANDSDRRSCTAVYAYPRYEITVEVAGRKPVDSSVLPGSEDRIAEARATALVEFRCTWKAIDGTGDGIKDLYIFTCRNGAVFEISTSSPPDWSRVSKDLFDVRLIDR